MSEQKTRTQPETGEHAELQTRRGRKVFFLFLGVGWGDKPGETAVMQASLSHLVCMQQKRFLLLLQHRHCKLCLKWGVGDGGLC